MNPRPGAGLLFDIDGTLVDTDALHLEAFNRVFGPRGHVFDRDRFTTELQGFSLASIMERFLSDEPKSRQIEIMAEKEAMFRELARGGLEPVEGLMALLDAADHVGQPMVAVTNAPRLNAEMMLGALHIRHRFRVLVIGDELVHGKPHPLPYLEGLRLLGAKAPLSMAFEDSRAGVASASSAGIATAGMLTSLTAGEMTAAGAAITAKDFNDPALLDFIGRVVAGL